MKTGREPVNRRGVALVLVLWVLVILSSIGLQMRLLSRADTGSARYLKENVQTYYLARGGLERGVGLLAEYYSRYPSNPLMAKTIGRDPRAASGARPQLLTYLADRTRDAVPLGEGSYRLRFEDLSGRVNVNRADPQLLANLVQLSGVDRSRAEEVTDGILDWIDADDLHRPRGAEREWYGQRGLPVPKNAPVTQLDELLLVKGITREVLYGGGRYQGLAAFLTTEGAGKINVNTAPAEILLAIPGMDQGTVTRILATRARGHMRSLDEALGPAVEERLGANPTLGILSFETTEMRIDAVGDLPGSRTRSHVRATVGILPAGVIVRSWRDGLSGGPPLAPGTVIRLGEASDGPAVRPMPPGRAS